jgi:hypothetical protein
MAFELMLHRIIVDIMQGFVKVFFTVDVGAA